MAYAGLEPFGEDAAFLRAGIIASTVANAARDPKRKKRPFTAADFIPDFGLEPEPVLTPAQKAAAFRAKADAIMYALGGRVRGDPRRPGRGRVNAQQRRR